MYLKIKIKKIIDKIRRQKCEIPSSVQYKAWLIIMNGHDLIAVSQTETGKTLAYLLSSFIRIDLQPTLRTT